MDSPKSFEAARDAAMGADARFQVSNDVADLSTEIAYLELTLSLAKPHHRLAYLMMILGMLGSTYAVRFDLAQDVTDLDASIRCYEQGLSFFPMGDPARAIMLKVIMDVLNQRLPLRSKEEKTGDTDKIIVLQRERLFLHPAHDHLGRSKILSQLACFLMERIQRNENMADIDECIAYCRWNLKDLPKADFYYSATLDCIASALLRRFEKKAEVVDLEECIIHLRGNLVPSAAVGADKHIATIGKLSHALRARFKHRGEREHIDESIELARQAVRLSTSDAQRSQLINRLESALAARFRYQGAMSDLEEMIELNREDLVLNPADDPLRPNPLAALSGNLQQRFEQRGMMRDLEEAIEIDQEVVMLLPMGKQGRPSALSNLGNTLRRRFRETGNRSDLERAIENYREAVSLATLDDPNRSVPLGSLGDALLERFEYSGAIAELDESIELLLTTLSLHPTGDSRRTWTLHNLSSGLLMRFKHKANMTDLDDCVTCCREDLSLRPAGNPSRSFPILGLATALKLRFQHTDQANDIHEAIQLYRESLHLHSRGHHAYGITQMELASALLLRFRKDQNKVGLQECVRYAEEGLLQHPSGHVWRSRSLEILGAALSSLYLDTGEQAYIDDCLRYLEEALLLRPIGHPLRADILHTLGNALRMRHARSGDVAFLEAALLKHKEAAGYELATVQDRLMGSRAWTRLARATGSESLVDAYASSMDLLDRSILLAGSSIPDSHAQLTHFGHNLLPRDVAMDAASYAIEKHEVKKAVEILERGRALLFTQLGKYQTPLDELEAVDPKLASRFRALSMAISNASLSEDSTLLKKATLDDAVARRQKQTADWALTLEEIRQLNGFESFLRATPFEKLQKAASCGPVILLNISRYGSSAIIVTATGEPLSILLPEATPSVVSALASSITQTTNSRPEQYESNRIFADILQKIWHKIVEPIINVLENTLKIRRGSRIWWIPTSAACALPLHASGPYQDGVRNLPDRFLSSYAPTMSTLIRARAGHWPSKISSGPRMLIVAQAGAEGEAQLPEVDREVELIRGIVKDGGVVNLKILAGDDCTREKVVVNLQNTAWAHFACHGNQDLAEPFKSHFSLRTRDNSLSLLDIIKTGLPQAEIAFLSACHSAAGDRSTPDEVIHLTAGMLFAGFRGVVGTMWAMSDMDGPVIAEEFYIHMLRNGPGAVDCKDAAKALFKGVKRLRNARVPFDRWVNFVHYGI